jgi:hypothetical protein
MEEGDDKLPSESLGHFFVPIGNGEQAQSAADVRTSARHRTGAPHTAHAAKPPCVGGLNHINHAPALQAGCVCGPKGCTPWG